MRRRRKRHCGVVPQLTPYRHPSNNLLTTHKKKPRQLGGAKGAICLSVQETQEKYQTFRLVAMT